MFKLGEYYEDDAKSIVKYLKDAKIKVEQKTYICTTAETAEYLEGRLSELKTVLKGIETYEGFLAVLKTTLAKGAKPDDFKELFLTELDPGWVNRKGKLAEIIEPPSGISDEVRAADSDKPDDKSKDLELEGIAKSVVAFDFALATLSRNDIEPGEDVGDRLDDPILRIRVNEADYKDSDLLRSTVSVFLEKRSELFVDELTSILFEDLDEDFEVDYPEEYLRIMTLGLLITDMVEEPSPGKIDMQAFSERCVIEMEKDGDILIIDGEETAEEIARVLEKNGIIKLKGGTIKWKNQPKVENR
ncbi:Uncharacterised protein [uncultured archaeon]|nr:Uncharacterised protein [uncultured archaeon]